MKLLLLTLLATCALGHLPASKQKTGPDAKIVGGQNAKQGQFPYLLSLNVRNNSICGAAIYSSRVMITAAQCVNGYQETPEELQIVAGELSFTEDSGYEQRRVVSEILVHEDFDSAYLYNDIALIYVEEALKFNENVRNIPLYEEVDPSAGVATVAGWGTMTNGDYPDVLQWVDVPVVSDQECRDSMIITNSMICAGEGGKDACVADGGEPLQCMGKHCGIVSWGYDCGKPGYPGVYTETAYYKEWITRNAVGF